METPPVLRLGLCAQGQMPAAPPSLSFLIWSCLVGPPLQERRRWAGRCEGWAGPGARAPQAGQGRYSLILQGGVTSRHSLCAPTPHLVQR